MKDTKGAIEYVRDRPFNDLRYAVDGSKLRKLGWEQKVSFEEGLATTVEWYGKFSNWWGPIESILTPFPMVKKEGPAIVVDAAAKELESASSCERVSQAQVGAEKHHLQNGVNGVNGGVNGTATNGASKKRKVVALDEE